MGFLELLIIAFALSMDAFAVAICKGLSMKNMNYKYAVIIACFFGGFQALMPLIGYILGIQFERYITSIDHWVAFGLLSLIGINMIRESKEEECDVACDSFTFNLKDIIVLALATSIDALAVGITFAFLKVEIVPAVFTIGITTFICSFIGVRLGNLFGALFKSKAEFVGGIILIIMGVKILLEHLGIINL